MVRIFNRASRIFNVKKLSISLMLGLALVLSPLAQVSALPTPGAYFTATDQHVYTGNIFNGTTVLTALNVTGGNPTRVVYYIDNAQVADQPRTGQETISNQLSVDLTTLANGVHHITAKVSDESGATSTVLTMGGLDNLTFTLNIPEGYSPSPAPEASANCSAQQANLNTITTRIVQRSQLQLSTVEGVVKALDTYYKGQPKTFPEYTALNTQLTNDYDEVQNALIIVVENSAMDCSGDVPAQIKLFKDSVRTAQSKLKTYISDTQTLLNEIEKL